MTDIFPVLRSALRIARSQSDSASFYLQHLIPENIEFSADTEYVVEKSDVIVLAVASPYTRSTAKLFAPFIKKDSIL